MKHKKGFTLLELLIVIAILAILATVVILVMNPAESIKRARDTQRISDMDNLKSALLLYILEGNTNIGGATCTTGSSPACKSNCCTSGGSYTCTGCSRSQSSAINGTGWIPVNFTTMAGGAPLSHLPTDPVNSGNYLYLYAASSTDFELNANVESTYYTSSNPIEANDGGDDSNKYEVGTVLTLINP
jgi:prepilin-type N-terminal cleavage/methylation domain-containing protein